MADKPIMARATAVWLVDNTTLTFRQIGDFCGMHELEVQGIADGDVAAGVKGFDPVANNQLETVEIEKGEKDPLYRLRLKFNPAAVGEEKRRGPRYTPLSKRQDRPAAILWLVKHHPELTDSQISKLVGTTKPTILAIRERTHWNIGTIDPIDPVALGLCRQSELDAAVQKAGARRADTALPAAADDRRRIMPTDRSLTMAPEPRLPTAIAGLETFTLSDRDDPRGMPDTDEEPDLTDFGDADSFFNLPAGNEDEDEDKGKAKAPRR
jgi:hypothetical protein